MFSIEGSGYCVEGAGIANKSSNIQTRTGGFGVTVSPFVIWVIFSITISREPSAPFIFIYAPLVHLVEQRSCKAKVVCSSQTGGTKLF